MGDFATTIKSITTKKFELFLVQHDTNGNYYVLSSDTKSSLLEGYPINDYNTASHVFDLKLKELEGN
jgi:hypothetical protein